MRLAFNAVVLLGLLGCIDHPDAPVVPGGSEAFPPATNTPQDPKAPAQPSTPPKSVQPSLQVLTEVVYVLMKGWDGGDWLCTGSLVAKDLVVTAGHCLDESLFESWEIVAPLAGDKPRVSASSPTALSGDFENIAEPDIGFLRLDDPINLPAYAVLTDVSARLEKGDKLTASTIVRTAEEPEAPFKSVDNLVLSSTTKLGYAHGLGAPIFSRGGDSGAGLFLVEDGQVTHKLIAVARNPDPDAKLDHFTRIDATFLDWFKENAAGE